MNIDPLSSSERARKDLNWSLEHPELMSSAAITFLFANANASGVEKDLLGRLYIVKSALCSRSSLIKWLPRGRQAAIYRAVNPLLD